MRMSRVFRTIVSGEPASKSKNKLTRNFRGKSISYQKAFYDQVPELGEGELILGDVGVVFDVYSSVTKLDLDESLILELLEGRAYKKNKQVKVKLIRHHLDKENPRTNIQVFKLTKGLKEWWDDIEMMTLKDTN